MNKVCQNCKQNFTIEPEDFVFYEKIYVPAPTFCPECRLVRRMVWRNERALYKRKCDAPGHNEEIISIYHKESLVKVYDQKYWWSDNWDPMDYGRDYDWNKPFFEQFRGLILTIPHIAVFNTKTANTIYANHAEGNKDCYLVFGAFRNENTLYAARPAYSKDSLDLYIVSNLELCYENSYCFDCFMLFFGINCQRCNNSFFLYDCRNCSDCFGCVGLRNKQYYIFGKPYSKEAYFKRLKEFDIEDYRALIKIKKEFEKFILNYPHKYAFLTKTINTFGDQVQGAKNCYYCFNLVKGPIEDCKFLEWGGMGLKDSYDCIGNGAGAEMHYEVIDGIAGSMDHFSIVNYNNSQTFYTINCHGCSNLFACIGLRNKQYCIFNKQYTKEQYEELVPKIIKHMNEQPYIDKKGRIYKYGEFFPPELSPFAYNETIAQEYFPLTKEQAINKGYRWKDQETRNYKITLKTEQIPDHIRDSKDDILDKIIQCSHYDLDKKQIICNEQCATAFKIIKPELEFYRKMNLPLPRFCPNCRHYQRIKQRNPLKLWHRQCQCAGEKSDNKVYQNTIQHFHSNKHCPNEFETTYSPDRKEIVYCEKCYQQEVM